MQIIEEKQAITTPEFTDQWLQRKPMFRIHQRVCAAPGVIGRISGMQQVESDQWRYQVSTPAEYGMTISWWDENQLKAYFDMYTVILVEEGEEIEGCMAGTLDEAIDDVRFYAEEAFRQYHEFGRKMLVQITCCTVNTSENKEEFIESFEASFPPNFC